TKMVASERPSPNTVCYCHAAADIIGSPLAGCPTRLPAIRSAVMVLVAPDYPIRLPNNPDATTPQGT
ncbi:hypothetical protein LCGC14_1853290, partial [marine sediment metagenome]